MTRIARDSYVWDLPTRVSHWALVVLFVFSWWSGAEGGLVLQYHMVSGYCILSIVLFRFSWGFWGTSSSLFSNFLRGPSAVLAYSKTILDRNTKRYPSHNPLGGWAVVLMLVVLFIQATTGLFANDDLFNEGPLYKYISGQLSDNFTTAHGVVAYFSISLIFLHILAIAFYQFWKNQHLTHSMITGRSDKTVGTCKRLPGVFWRGSVLALLSVALVALIVNF